MQNTIADSALKLTQCLVQYTQNPQDGDALAACFESKRVLACAVAKLTYKDKEGDGLSDITQSLERLAESGIWDFKSEYRDRTLVQEYAGQGWQGLLASMLLVPAFQWPEAPLFDDVPLFLWEPYAKYVFYAPNGFTEIGDAEQYGKQALRWLDQLRRLVEANRGSAAVRTVTQAYLSKASCIPLYFSTLNLRRHYELRGQILTLVDRAGTQEVPLLIPREGRRLKVGFLNRHFGPQTETYTTLPSFESLDSERFEVKLFALQQTNTPLENYASKKVGPITFLPKVLDEQLKILRDETLDVLVFGTNVTAVVNEVTRLALYRIAPLQVVNNSSCTTSGLPEVDMYISGSLTEFTDSPSHYTERLALLPGPAHAFNYNADQSESTCRITREDLKVPNEAILFVSASNYFKITPEMMDCWAELLSRTPGSYLLLHPFNPNWTLEYPVKRFTKLIEQALVRRGVDHSRLVISTIRFPSRSDVSALLGLGDIYIDSFPFGGVNSIIDPLEKGIPVVEWEGACFRSRMGSAVMRQLNIPELCAGDRESYLNLCMQLANDPALRKHYRERITQAMQHLPLFFDVLAASDAFGELLNIAFDELTAKGHDVFRRSGEPIIAKLSEDSSTVLATAGYLADIGMVAESQSQIMNILACEPANPLARQRMAKMLMSAGRYERAVEYLMSAVQSNSLGAECWRDLSTALHRSGNGPAAIQALETALRIDHKDVASWLMLSDLAWSSGHAEIYNDIYDMVQQLDPDDTRVKALLARGKLQLQQQ